MKPVTFTARITKIGILRDVIVPSRIASALGGEGRVPVIARYAGATTESTIVPAGGGNRRLVLKMDVLRRAQLDVGDSIEVTLSRLAQPTRPEWPPDLRRALQFRPVAATELDRSSPSTWRMLVESLEKCRTPESRERMIEKIVEKLAENAAARRKKS